MADFFPCGKLADSGLKVKRIKSFLNIVDFVYISCSCLQVQTWHSRT